MNDFMLLVSLLGFVNLIVATTLPRPQMGLFCLNKI
jgi:hypothetical protein